MPTELWTRRAAAQTQEARDAAAVRRWTYRMVHTARGVHNELEWATTQAGLVPLVTALENQGVFTKAAALYQTIAGLLNDVNCRPPQCSVVVAAFTAGDAQSAPVTNAKAWSDPAPSKDSLVTAEDYADYVRATLYAFAEQSRCFLCNPAQEIASKPQVAASAVDSLLEALPTDLTPLVTQLEAEASGVSASNMGQVVVSAHDTLKSIANDPDVMPAGAAAVQPTINAALLTP